jgi:hypothetical protein
MAVLDELLKLHVDVALEQWVPFELRLMNVVTGKFVSIRSDHDVPKFVDTWEEASYYSCCGEEYEYTFEFVWDHFARECECDWLYYERPEDYKVHVLRGCSDL